MANIKYFKFKNRAEKKINTRVTIVDNPKGVCFVQHGFTGNMDEEQIKIFERLYTKNGWNVVNINCTNSFNDSDGKIDDFTFGRHKTDLSDSIKWAKEQKWYKEPIALIGHSAGGFSVIMNAVEYNDIIDHIVPVSTVTSGINLISSYKDSMKEEFEKWQRQGYRDIEQDGSTDRISMKNIFKFIDYSVFDDLHKISVPAYFIVGSDDDLTKIEHIRRAYDRIKSCDKKFIIIDGANHCFDNHLKILEEKLSNLLYG